jgi:hypothetical protein
MFLLSRTSRRWTLLVDAGEQPGAGLVEVDGVLGEVLVDQVPAPTRKYCLPHPHHGFLVSLRVPSVRFARERVLVRAGWECSLPEDWMEPSSIRTQLVSPSCTKSTRGFEMDAGKRRLDERKETGSESDVVISDPIQKRRPAESKVIQIQRLWRVISRQWPMAVMILRHVHLSKWEKENWEGKAYKSRIVEPISSCESVPFQVAKVRRRS